MKSVAYNLLAAEPAFLVAAVRHFLNPDTALPDTGNIDWGALLRLASIHAVTPMLHSALHGAGLPEAVAAELRAGYEISVQGSLAQSGELARLSGMLEEQGIPVIAVKGPLLSRYLYGHLAARSSGDIDLLARPEDVLRIRDVVVPREYYVVNSLHWNSDSAYLRSRESEISFGSPSGVNIDVHWRLLLRYFASPFDGLDVWKSWRTTELAGRQVRTLPPEQVLLLICSHSAKHAFERLGWICDIARFLMVTPDLDWPALVAQARRTRTMRQVSLSVRLAADVLGAPLPRGVPEDPAVDRLAALVKGRLLAGAGEIPPRDLTRFCLALLESPYDRLRFLAGHYLTPSEAEYMALRLPPALYFLYYPFRPARLFHKHVLSTAR